MEVNSWKLEVGEELRTFELHPVSCSRAAQMAELVDAADSKSAVRKDVQVRFLFWAQNPLFEGAFLYSQTEYQ